MCMGEWRATRFYTSPRSRLPDLASISPRSPPDLAPISPLACRARVAEHGELARDQVQGLLPHGLRACSESTTNQQDLRKTNSPSATGAAPTRSLATAQSLVQTRSKVAADPSAERVLLRRRRRRLVCVAPRARSRAKDAAEPLLGGAVGGGGGGRALRREGRRARAAQPRHGQRRHRLGGALRRRVGGEKGEVVGGACVTAAVGWRRASTAQCGALSASRDVDGREYRRRQGTSLEKVPLSSRRSRVLGLGAALCRLSLPPLSAASREASASREACSRR